MHNDVVMERVRGHFGSEVDFMLFIIVKVVEQHTYQSVHALTCFTLPWLLQEGTEEWFILGEDPVGTDQENTSDNKNVGGKENISGTEQEQEGETAKQVGVARIQVCVYIFHVSLFHLIQEWWLFNHFNYKT